jgi:hypothetical protein
MLFFVMFLQGISIEGPRIRESPIRSIVLPHPLPHAARIFESEEPVA